MEFKSVKTLDNRDWAKDQYVLSEDEAEDSEEYEFFCDQCRAYESDTPEMYYLRWPEPNEESPTIFCQACAEELRDKMLAAMVVGITP